MEVGGQFHAPATLPRGKNPSYPLYRRLGGPQNRYGGGGEEKDSNPPIIQPVAQRHTIELSLLLSMTSSWLIN
jgi:hypothetical protein